MFDEGFIYDILNDASYQMDNPSGVEVEVLVDGVVKAVEGGPVLDYPQRLVILSFDTLHNEEELRKVLNATRDT